MSFDGLLGCCCDPVIDCPTTLRVRVHSPCQPNRFTAGITVTAVDRAGVLDDVTDLTDGDGYAVLVLDPGGGTFDVHVDQGICTTVIEGVELLPCERRTLPDVGPCCTFPIAVFTLTTPYGVLPGFRRVGANPFAVSSDELWIPFASPLVACNGYSALAGAYVLFTLACFDPPGAPLPRWRFSLVAGVCPPGSPARPGGANGGLEGVPSGNGSAGVVIATADQVGGTCDPVNLSFEVDQILYPIAAADLGIALGDVLTLTP